ncbi:MAG: UDP-N-acetylmuramoyl-tripeptide--D-alanyl-D-alanine ligase [Endozoicomonas sp.]
MIQTLSLSSLATLAGGSIRGGSCQSDESQEEVQVRGVSIDTRTLKSGDLFIAIKGPRFDGHAYIAQAAEAGASAALTEHYVENVEGEAIPQIVVADTRKALGVLGAANRDAFSGVVIGVTGSCGKTSVKEMLMAVFSGQGPTLATEGNLNNALGVPLTLLRIESRHEYAVIEMGTSSPGEIAYVAGLGRPDVSLITNADETHLADLVDVQGVAHEKGFILDALSSGGAAVLNRDDAFYRQWCDRVHSAGVNRVVSFSLSDERADCYASQVVSTESGMAFVLHVGEQSLPVRLSFWGQHQVLNACCAAAVARAQGLPLDIIASGLENARPFQRRGQRFHHTSGALLIDETYNANPRATLAAVDQLADCGGKTIMVMGDMLDLGEVSDQRHRDVGLYARERGVDHFLSLGPSARLACEAFGKGLHFDSKPELIDWLEPVLAKGVSVLVKGSRGMKMLDVIKALAGPDYKGEA